MAEKSDDCNCVKLNVTRCWFTPLSTIGCIDSEGVFICYTLEPSEASGKLIPEGTYQFTMYYSPRHQRFVPLIQDVPGETFVEIHPGNDAQDTQGCTLVGRTRDQDWLGSSEAAFLDLVTLLSTRTGINWLSAKEEEGPGLLAKLAQQEALQIEYSSQREVSA